MSSHAMQDHLAAHPYCSETSQITVMGTFDLSGTGFPHVPTKALSFILPPVVDGIGLSKYMLQCIKVSEWLKPGFIPDSVAVSHSLSCGMCTYNGSVWARMMLAQYLGLLLIACTEKLFSLSEAQSMLTQFGEALLQHTAELPFNALFMRRNGA